MPQYGTFPIGTKLRRNNSHGNPAVSEPSGIAEGQEWTVVGVTTTGYDLERGRFLAPKAKASISYDQGFLYFDRLS